jgi:hypothetical protein
MRACGGAYAGAPGAALQHAAARSVGRPHAVHELAEVVVDVDDVGFERLVGAVLVSHVVERHPTTRKVAGRTELIPKRTKDGKTLLSAHTGRTSGCAAAHRREGDAQKSGALPYEGGNNPTCARVTLMPSSGRKACGTRGGAGALEAERIVATWHDSGPKIYRSAVSVKLSRLSQPSRCGSVRLARSLRRSKTAGLSPR